VGVQERGAVMNLQISSKAVQLIAEQGNVISASIEKKMAFG
jgi:hypothetical protein